MKRNTENWKLDASHVTSTNSKHFFSYDFNKHQRKARPAMGVNFDFVYHSLPIQPIEDVESLGKSFKLASLKQSPI